MEKGAAKTPPGCYSGAAALGKQISCESERRAGRQKNEPGVPEHINIMYNMVTGGQEPESFLYPSCKIPHVDVLLRMFDSRVRKNQPERIHLRQCYFIKVLKIWQKESHDN